ncbi:MAG: NADH-quinone oxidoreductase subunit NuoH [Phycisphaerales bacterium]|nr:NADH-quinone oxidoreductase subunit NuoH [Phycisphaerales bacterium]
MRDFFTSQFGFSLLLALVVYGTIQGAVAYCILLERKIAAWTQDRYGPNRAGPLGLFQPFADGLKFLFKEDYIPGHVDRVLFVLAPGLVFLIAGIAFLVIPWGGRLDVSTLPWLGDAYKPGERVLDVQVVSLNVGLLYILAVMSLSVYGVVLGGWSSNNKYSFYGAMRACAQMLAYEIPMGLAILVVALTMGSLRLEEILADQASTGVWNVFRHPLAALILFITALAEANRAPFDLAEAEQELVGGYHTEYGALKFGLFFLAEYASMITTSALIVVLFFGGWHVWFLGLLTPQAASAGAVLAKLLVFGGKVAVMIFVYMWIRWSLPRFRFDQLMRLAWKSLVPLSLGLFVSAAGLLYFGWHRSIPACLATNTTVLVGALIVAARSKAPITGRQANLLREGLQDEHRSKSTGAYSVG